MTILTLPTSPRHRLMAFLDDFQALPNDADIDMHTGQMEDGTAALVVILGDGKGHGLTTKEARSIADIFEGSMRECPDDPRAIELPNIIMMLRMGADKSDAAAQRAALSIQKQQGEDPCNN